MKDNIFTTIILILALILALCNMALDSRITELESENYRLREKIVELKVGE